MEQAAQGRGGIAIPGSLQKVDVRSCFSAEHGGVGLMAARSDLIFWP